MFFLVFSQQAIFSTKGKTCYIYSQITVLYILGQCPALKFRKVSHEVFDPCPTKHRSCWTHVYLGSGPKLCLNSCKTNPVRFSPGPCLGLEWVKCLSLCLWCNFLGSELMVLRTGPKIAFSRIWNFERLNSWQVTIDYNHGGQDTHNYPSSEWKESI